MDAKQYQTWTQPLRDNPRAARALVGANKAITWVYYVLYPLLLLGLLITGNPFLLRAIIVPPAGFLAVTLLRKAVNQARPYEALDIDPLIKKDTVGNSFPSRHSYSIFAISMTILACNVPAGIVSLVAGCCLAVMRVLGGVHYPHDVIAGAAIGIAFGMVGFWIV